MCSRLNLIRSVGFDITATPQDSVASIPLTADLDDMHAKITGIIETYAEDNLDPLLLFKPIQKHLHFTS
jgi:hypothetical protein